MHYFFSGNIKQSGLVMDKLTTATPNYIYSLRKVTKNAPANAIRVRRSSDNSELDIGFSGNNLDTGSLLDFVGTENLFIYSDQFDNANWSKSNILAFGSGSVANTSATLDPIGTNTADLIVEDSANTTHYVQQFGPTLSSGTTYTFSVYAKKGGRDWLHLLLPSGVFTSGSAYFDLANGVLGSTSGGVTATISSVGNGWYRCSISKTATSSAGGNYAILMASANNTISYQGNGTSGVYLWGAQLNSGSTPNTYNRTSGAVGGNGFVVTWYNQVVGNQDVTQATAGDQPRIVSGGVLFTQNNKPSVDWFSVTQDNKGLLAASNASIYQSMCVFSMRAGCGSNSRVTGDMRISTSAGTGFWVSAHTGTPQGAINGGVLQDFGTIPVPTTYPLSIIYQVADSASIRPSIGNTSGSTRSWYGGISEVIHFNGNLSEYETSKLLKEQSKYYGIVL